MAFCANCGAAVGGNYCAGCGSAVAGGAPGSAAMTAADAVKLAQIQAEVARQNRRHGIPALLSFFIPGLGQLIKGQFLRGVIYFIGAALAVASIAVGFGFILAPIVWIWQTYDAYTSPE